MDKQETIQNNQHISNAWCSYCSPFMDENIIIPEILQFLDKQGYVKIVVTYGKLSHSFVVCDTKRGQVMTDIDVNVVGGIDITDGSIFVSAYIDLGALLLRLMREPSVETWNDVFELEVEEDIEGEFSLSYNYKS